MTATFDVSEVTALAADIAASGKTAIEEARTIVQQGALNIKTRARELAGGMPHAPRYPYSITYDTTVTDTSIEAEIGPDKDLPVGALGNIFEYGTSRHGPYRPHMGVALTEEEPRFERFVDALAARLL